MKKYIKNQLMTRDKRLYYDFLPPMIEIIEKPANMLVNVIMYTCFALILTVIIWACFARLDISVTAYGSVKSEEAIDSMISLVSGTIENVNYKEGDYLKKGDVLCTLVSDANDSAVEQYRYKLETLRIQKELYEKLYEKYENNDYSSLEADITAYGDNSVPATEIILENEVFLQNLAISGADNEAYLKNNQRLNVVKKINEINEETKNVTTQLESSEQNLRNTRITAAQSGYLTMNSFDKKSILLMSAAIVNKCCKQFSGTEYDCTTDNEECFEMLYKQLVTGKACCHLEKDSEWEWVRNYYLKNRERRMKQ